MGTTPRRVRIAVLTPPHRGAIAVLRVWGPDALAMADSVFRPAHGFGLASTPPGCLRLGRIGSGLGDEVVAVVLESCQGEGGDSLPPPSVEIQCHGGIAACELVTQALLDEGASLALSAEWITDQGQSPIKAAAQIELSRAATVRTAEILLDQAQGTLDREIDEVLAMLHAGTEASTKAAALSLNRLIGRGEIGLRLLQGWRVVLTGRPNVGKSSLLNALAGYRRSIVHESPGTTRDVVTVSLAVDGWPIEVSDTAGIRETSRVLEATGIERARQAIAQADLILPVVDSSQPLLAEDRELIRSVSDQGTPIVVNKSDLPTTWDPSELGIERSCVFALSARDGTGIAQLVSAIGQCLVPAPLPPGAGVPFRLTQVDAIREAKDLVKQGNCTLAAARLVRMIGG